jgi:hypothetical protein
VSENGGIRLDRSPGYTLARELANLGAAGPTAGTSQDSVSEMVSFDTSAP